MKTRIIPCLDVRDGRTVKGVRFAGLADMGDPAELAARYQSEGADEITLLDVGATIEGRAHRAVTTRSVRERLRIPLTVGGGITSVADAQQALRFGADKVAVNSAAVADPELLTRLADEFGRQCVVLAIDASRSGERWQVRTHSGGRAVALDAVEWAFEASAHGAGEILLTSFDRDGTRAGYDLPLLRAVRAAIDVPLIASGGADGPDHMADAVAAGADAVLAASIFHRGEWNIAKLKRALVERGIEVRLPC